MDNVKIAKEIAGDLNSMLSKMSSLLENIPAEAKHQMPGAIHDVNKISEALKDGDFNKIIEIQKKYANPDNK